MNSLLLILACLACLALSARSESNASNCVVESSLKSMIKTSIEAESNVSNCVVEHDSKVLNLAVIAVDLQNSFVKNELPVLGADKIFGPISILMEFFPKIRVDPIYVASKDEHTDLHISFTTAERPPFTQFEYNLTLENGTTVSMTQTAWPRHAEAGTSGAEFDERFNSTGFKVFKKGTNSMIDSYSAFGDELGGLVEDTGLHTYFQEQNVNTVIVFGLATDYCVQYTIKDAFRLGYKVILFLPGSAGITPEGVNSTIELVEKNGGLVIRNMMELYKIQTEIYENNEEYEFKRNNYVIQK
jgi:nicotinamidase/pyrazinamidase